MYLSYILCRGKLRQIIYRCLHQAMYVLGAPTGMIGRLVPVVVDTLVCARVFDNKLISCLKVFRFAWSFTLFIGTAECFGDNTVFTKVYRLWLELIYEFVMYIVQHGDSAFCFREKLIQNCQSTSNELVLFFLYQYNTSKSPCFQCHLFRKSSWHYHLTTSLTLSSGSRISDSYSEATLKIVTDDFDLLVKCDGRPFAVGLG